MYPLINLELGLANQDFFSFTKDEAKKYFKWFLKIINERLQVLESQVQELFPEWKLDYTKSSFEKLYEWFSEKVEYRTMSENEKEEVKQQIEKTPLLADVITIPEKTFTNDTVSICFDIGMYFGEALIFNVPSVKWVQKITSKSYIDYAQPLISNQNSKVPINPRRIAESLAQQILDEEVKKTTFAELLDKWSSKFSNYS